MKSALISIAPFAAFVAVLGAAAAPAHAETFDGPYVGVTAGWERSDIADRIEAQPITGQASRDAVVLGGYAGYNLKATDRIVIGAEAGFSATVDDKTLAASAGKSLTIDPRYMPVVIACIDRWNRDGAWGAWRRDRIWEHSG